MKFIPLVLVLLILLSCNSHSKLSWIKEFEEEGFTYLGEIEPPHGISDTVVFGYTDQENLVCHPTSERFKTLTIKGYKLEDSDAKPYKKTLMIYHFEFGDASEKSTFEGFQKYLLNYQRNHKNGVEFIEREGDWLLKFVPMP